jgi:hypothetical protein
MSEPINPGHAAKEYLAARGISLETVSQNRIELRTSVGEDRVLAKTYRLRLNGLDNWPNAGPFHEIIEESIWFPCMDADSTVHSWIVRPFPPLPGKNDSNPVKFLTPKDGNGCPFIPLGTWRVKDKTNRPLLITEGPCKALAALQAGAYPIAVSGVWMATTNKAGITQLHQALIDNFTFRARTVYVAFDADFLTNPSVRQALIRVSVLLYREAAEVKILTWPPSDGKGLDDYLAKTSNGSRSSASVLDSLYSNPSSTVSGILF